MELVNEQAKIPACGCRPVSQGHRPKLELRHQKGTKQSRLVLPKPALGQVGDEKSSMVHDIGNIHQLADLAQNISNFRIQQELTDFFVNRRDGLPLELVVVVFILVSPKRPMNVFLICRTTVAR